MIDVFIRFLRSEPRTMLPLINIVLVAVWFLLLVSALGSLYSQPWSRPAKLVWGLLVVFFPPVGLLAYAGVCLLNSFRGELPRLQ